MRIIKLSLDSLTLKQFSQLVELEENCGLEPYSPEMIMQCICTMDTFAGVKDGDILGFITGIPNGVYMGKSIYVVNINVGETYRRRGVGKKLLLHLCEYYLKDYRNLPITLDVAKNNPAKYLYDSLGFRETDIPSRNGLTDLVMATTLLDLKKQMDT